ncbi:dTDP-glucose 4,6-dehydratase [Caenispirillum salinarum AK4]|uniref:dTDP-glucose 4,6-dehydratase n=1 Tax=Caenispirillum salinarum AK4 TaxID=1238182 RepID=K9GN32_9PROT|nr:dTDP-glucose 4,6-dehydratase [Caenispirillum salinarum AK4]
MRRLLKAGHTVVVADLLTYAGNRANLAEVANDRHFTFEAADICDASAMADVFHRYQPTAVLHLAAESHVDRSIDGPAAFIRTNVDGTGVMLQAARAYQETLPQPARDAFRFVHVSTDEVFGALSAHGRFSEESPYRPNSPYAASKAAADHLVRAWHVTYGLPTLVVNASNTYGPRQFPEKLIPLTLIRALQGRTLPVYGRGENVRDWLHVDDHADALVAVLSRGAPGRGYCIGGGCELANIDVARTLCRLLDEASPRADGLPHESAIAFVADRPGHDLRYALNSSRAAAELGWRPRVRFHDGLRDTVRWYLDNRPWWEAILRGGAYGGERLGLASDEPEAGQ